MSYPSNYYNEQSDRFGIPLEASPFEDFQSYFEARLSQLSRTVTAGSSSPSKRPQQFLSIPSASDPNLWHSNASSSSNSRPISGNYSFPSSSQTSDVPPLGFYTVPNASSQNAHPPPFVPLTEVDYTFLANIDPLLLDADITNGKTIFKTVLSFVQTVFLAINNSSISYLPESVGHGSSPSRKRPRVANEGPEPNNTSIDAFSNPKRRRLSAHAHQTPPSTSGKAFERDLIINQRVVSGVQPSSTNTYNNGIISTSNGFCK